MTDPAPVRPEIVVDLAAVRHNLATLADLVAPALAMAVVKADGYGHGMVEVARAARAVGISWLGVATLPEALALRTAGDTGRVLGWMAMPEDDFDTAIAADVDVAAYTPVALDRIAAAARNVGGTARVHLKIDTGLSRGGAAGIDWPDLVTAAARHERSGEIEVVGIWTHPACADEPSSVVNDLQETNFREAVRIAEEAGLRPEVRHFANSATGILRPSARFDLVRFGIASYGLDPAPGHLPEDLDLRPAMSVRAPVVLTKQVEAGEGVSYSHTWHAERPTRLALVPLGYGDGVPRHASSRGEVWISGKRRPIRGRVCMDQFVVELGPVGSEDEDPVEVGDEVVLFNAGGLGEPTAQDWARAAGTINYEIVTRIGGRALRRHVSTEGDPR